MTLSGDPVQARIDAFARRFGQPHLAFACHAAFSMVLTPDLAYCLWFNFRQDVEGEDLGIPWIAVSDLLLSSLCREVDCELYEMRPETSRALRDRLLRDPSLGPRRREDVCEFLHHYVERSLHSAEAEERSQANVQQWVALCYTRPGEATEELRRLAGAAAEVGPERLRLKLLSEALDESLSGYEPLLARPAAPLPPPAGAADAAPPEPVQADTEPYLPVQESQATEPYLPVQESQATEPYLLVRQGRAAGPPTSPLVKRRPPLLGYNHNVRHAGRLYHVQTEDGGTARAHLTTHVFLRGVILMTNRTPYDPDSPDEVVMRLMQSQHKAALRSLRDGTFDERAAAVAPEPAADPVVRTKPYAGLPDPTTGPVPGPDRPLTDAELEAHVLELEAELPTEEELRELPRPQPPRPEPPHAPPRRARRIAVWSPSGGYQTSTRGSPPSPRVPKDPEAGAPEATPPLPAPDLPAEPTRIRLGARQQAGPGPPSGRSREKTWMLPSRDLFRPRPAAEGEIVQPQSIGPETPPEGDATAPKPPDERSLDQVILAYLAEDPRKKR